MAEPDPTTPATKPSVRPRSLWRRMIGYLLKLVLAALLVYLLYAQNQLDLAVLGSIRFDQRTVGILLFGALAVLLGKSLLAFRLKLVLGFSGFSLPLGRAFGLIAAASLASSVFPGLIGGDVLKAAYLCGNAAERKSAAFAAVVIDRALGLYSLFVLASITFAIGLLVCAVPADMPVLWIAPAVTVVGALGMAIIAWERLFQSTLIQAVNGRLPKGVKNFIEAMRACLRSPGLLAKVLILSLVNHAFIVLTYVAGGLLIAHTLPGVVHFITDPLAMVLNGVAITPGGLGITENGFAFLYDAVGSSNGAMVGLLGRLVQYAVFLIAGSLAFIIMRVNAKIETHSFM